MTQRIQKVIKETFIIWASCVYFLSHYFKSTNSGVFKPDYYTCDAYTHTHTHHLPQIIARNRKGGGEAGNCAYRDAFKTSARKTKERVKEEGE